MLKKAPVTYLGAETRIEGVFWAKGKVRLDGEVRGSVQVEGDLEVGPTGRIEGERVEAQTLEVHGEVRANVRAQKVVLAKTARVYGNVATEVLDIEAGARFVGQSLAGEAPQALPSGQEG
jgi:cytoskeletal protein CcmA (bactofilin family)